MEGALNQSSAVHPNPSVVIWQYKQPVPTEYCPQTSISRTFQIAPVAIMVTLSDIFGDTSGIANRIQSHDWSSISSP